MCWTEGECPFKLNWKGLLLNSSPAYTVVISQLCDMPGHAPLMNIIILRATWISSSDKFLTQGQVNNRGDEDWSGTFSEWRIRQYPFTRQPTTNHIKSRQVEAGLLNTSDAATRVTIHVCIQEERYMYAYKKKYLMSSGPFVLIYQNTVRL